MDTLPAGMHEVYRNRVKSLPSDDRKTLVAVLRWLICGEGEINANWIADDLFNTFSYLDEATVSDVESDADDSEFAASEFEDDEEEDDVETPKEMSPNPASDDRGIIPDLRKIGRDFLK